MARIAVDAMGGDQAPGQIVLGAVDAAKEGHDLLLVGDPDVVRPILHEVGFDLEIVPAREVIEMDDDPGAAIREKKDASITVAARLVSSGAAAGLVSAGSTGAALAAAALVVGRLPGVARPAIASLFPGDKVVLDSGANLACRPEHLVQFAVMGAALAETVLHISKPRVGLINIGEEKGKGRDLEKSTFDLLSDLSDIEFVGNVEGRALGTHHADVLVTDGFTGNVLLKTAEGAARLIQGIVMTTLERPDYADAVAQLAPALTELQVQLNPETTGGAHLLGTKGVVVIAHGSSSRVAIANAIAIADDGAQDGLVEKIASGVAAAGSG